MLTVHTIKISVQPVYRSTLLLFFLTIGTLATAQTDRFERMRQDMVTRQIQQRGITDKQTLEAMRSVRRHLFVPAESRMRAYEDRPLPIGYGQTISQPYIVGFMTETIEPGKGQRVLEIGTGSGYQAAVLARIVDSVYTIEIVEELHEAASDRLANLGYDNVVAKHADGYYGWEEKAPFDAIVVTAAAEFIPQPLIEQLREGGIMIIPVGSPFMVQQLIRVEKRNGKPHTKQLMPVRFVPFKRSDQ